MFGESVPAEDEMWVLVEHGHPRWHDKSVNKLFRCEHCGAEGGTGEADAICDECGRKTYLPIEVIMSREEYREHAEKHGDLQRKN